MSTTATQSLELSITKLVDAPQEVVYRTWTERFSEWFPPFDMTVPSFELDLRPGGSFSVVMKAPTGEEYPGDGTFLQVSPERIVFTDAFDADFKPGKERPFMVGSYSFEPQGDKTLVTAKAEHWTEEDKQKHIEMGFYPGWGSCLDKLASLAEGAGRG